jgi:hypothetical protein
MQAYRSMSAGSATQPARQAASPFIEIQSSVKRKKPNTAMGRKLSVAASF